MQQLPRVHRNCSCKTFWSTFLVQLFERACCLYMPPHFTIRHWGEGNLKQAIIILCVLLFILLNTPSSIKNGAQSCFFLQYVLWESPSLNPNLCCFKHVKCINMRFQSHVQGVFLLYRGLGSRLVAQVLNEFY